MLALAQTIIWRPVGPTLAVWAGAVIVAGLAILACWRTWPLHALLSVASLIMRLLLIAALTVILLGPSAVPPQVADQRRPKLTVLLDTSQSMLTDDCGTVSRIEFAAAQWLGPDRIDALSAEHEVELLGFHDRAQPLSRRALSTDPTSTAVGRTTHLADALSQVLLQVPTGEGAGRSILLLSDGHDTDDAPLTAAIDLARARSVPVHTVCLGSATQQRDLAVFAVAAQSQLLVNEPGELVIKAYQSGLSTASTTLRVSDGDGEFLEEVAFDGKPVIEVRLPVKKEQPGQYEYTVWLEPHDDEVELNNNRQTVFCDVTDERIKVLLLEGQPYWDTKFLAQSLRKDDRVELTQITQLSAGKKEAIVTRTDEGAPAVPEAAADFAVYDVIVLGAALENVLDEEGAQLLMDYVSRNGGNVILARGKAWGDDLLGQRVGAKLFDLTPVIWGKGLVEELDLAITSAGRTSSWLASTSMGVDTAAAVAELPGFVVMRNIERTKVAAIVLAEARPSGTGPSRDGDLPALVTMRSGRGNVAAVLGEGLWRWSLLQREHRDLAGFYDAFWSNLVRWLAMGGDLQPGQDVSLKLGRTSAWVDDMVTIDVVYRISPPEGTHLAVTVTDPDGRTVEVPMHRRPGRDPRYQAAVEARTTGVYRVELRTPGLDPQQQTRAFSVHELNLERLQSAAAPGTMRRLADATGGQTLEPLKSDRLEGVLERQRLAMIVPEAPQYIWDKGLVLFSLLVWAGLEWLLRRRGGLL